MAKVPTSLAKALGPNHANVLSLVHSSIDISQELHDFSLWLASEKFVNTPRRGGDSTTVDSPAFQVNQPIAFENYMDKNQCQGFGLKAVGAIGKDQTIFKMKTQLGMVTNSLADDLHLKTDHLSPEELEDDKHAGLFADAVTAHTRKVANLLMGSNPPLANRLNHQLLLVQKLIAATRKEQDESPAGQFLDCYFNTLPRHDLSQLVYWDRDTLNKVDSTMLKQAYTNSNATYQSMHKFLIDDPASPYRDPNFGAKNPDKAPIPVEEFMWAWAIVQSRALVLNNTAKHNFEDPNFVMMMMPLLDMVNHSFDPNVIFVPYHDKLTDQSYVAMQALREIQPNEQLCIKYGDLANNYLLQKYGFTVENNPQQEVFGNFPYHDYNSLIFEEQKLKKEKIKELKFAFMPKVMQVKLHPDKFAHEQIKMLRLAFLTSKTLINNGGSSFALNNDFSLPIDETNESMVYNFLLESIEGHLEKYRSTEYYTDQITQLEEKQISSISQFNQRNMYRIHLDEKHVFEKNLDYLTKARKETMNSFL